MTKQDWNWFIPFLIAVLLFLSVVYDATAQSLILTLDETTASVPDTSFSLNDSTGFAADSIDFGQDTSKTWNVTASNVTWTVDLTDSSEAGISTTSNSFTATYTPTTAGAYDDSVKLTTSLLDTLYLGITGTGVDTASGVTGPAELSGNFTSDAFGFEDGDVDDVSATNAGGSVTISVNSSDPIYGSYSCNVTQTSTQSMADRPIINFNTTSAITASTSHTIRFTIRNNDGSNSISARFMFLGGLVNPTDPVIAAGATEDFEITINSGGTGGVSYFGLYIYEGNSYNFDIDIDNVSIKEN